MLMVSIARKFTARFILKYRIGLDLRMRSAMCFCFLKQLPFHVRCWMRVYIAYNARLQCEIS